MDLLKVFHKWPTHESCIEYLEQVRWGLIPACPLCRSVDVARKVDGYRVGRWNCYGCKSSFNVLSGTIFQKTKVPLQKWFLAIALILNAKKSISSHQLARDLDLTQPTARYLAMRIRRAMGDQGDLLSRIAETDEAYIGGKSWKGNRRDDDEPSKRGNDTDELPILGAVEGGGQVASEPSRKVNAVSLTQGLMRHIDTGPLLVSYASSDYRLARQKISYAVTNHLVQSRQASAGFGVFLRGVGATW